MGNCSECSSNPYPYPYPYTVNVSNFVSVKLTSGTDNHNDNYAVWRGQMLCLLESLDLLGFIDGTTESPDPDHDAPNGSGNYKKWRRSDTLVKGWILGSISEPLLSVDLVNLQTAKDVWEKLHTDYGSESKGEDAIKKEKEEDEEGEKDSCKYLPLYRATLEGNWEEVERIIEQDPQAPTAKLSPGTNVTALHIAVGIGDRFSFLKKLLDKVPPDILPTMKGDVGYTPLHMAAIFGNTVAVKMLIDRSPELLYVEDNHCWLPIHRALFNSKEQTFRYLLSVMITRHDINVNAIEQPNHLPREKEKPNYNPDEPNPSSGLKEEPNPSSELKEEPNIFVGVKGVTLVTESIFYGYYDVALDLLQRFPAFATTKTDIGCTPLVAIARKFDATGNGKQRHYISESSISSYMPMAKENCRRYNRNWVDIESQEKTYSEYITTLVRCLDYKATRGSQNVQGENLLQHQALQIVKRLCEEIKKLKDERSYDYHLKDAMMHATDNDAFEIVMEIVHAYPEAIWYKDDDGYYILQLAIINRCERVYNTFVYQMSEHRQLHITLTDDNGNNLLHMVGRLAPAPKLNRVSGAALQMQQELQWFKEVEKFMRADDITALNSDKETPAMVFTKAHQQLVKDGEEWLKKTADSYTITAALIITIVFAAAITVPGGNNGATGDPIFTTKGAFIIFAVSDAISLFTSTTSLLLFLSILTARFSEQDFLYTLPKRLILGLAALFVSTTAMLVAFSATLYLVFGRQKQWILIPIALLACLPITSFMTLQFPLLRDIVSSTYGAKYGYGIFGKQNDRRLY